MKKIYTKYSSYAHTMRSVPNWKRIDHAKECIKGKWGEMSVNEINFLSRYVSLHGR